MPARKVIAHQGEYYHIYNRGALKMTLFYSPYMYELFLMLLIKYADRFNISVINVCLMPNHFHLIVRVENSGSVEMFMQLLCGVYSRKVNKHQRRTGTIFEGRYHIKHIQGESYFVSLCRYVHLNPVRAALAKDPSMWNYSNFQECIGARNQIATKHQIINEMFGTAARYEEFVRLGIDETRIADASLAQTLAEMHIV